ncbi:MAG TPA: hypothetical protein VK906_14570 [Egicoccus sp.]|nr:hypothetical protein [Egicoccus sp.]HSK24406.1 hypothetical protein [Egicoccus sp.]
MSISEPGTTRADATEHDLDVLSEDEVTASHGCVVCGGPVEKPGCCSFPCVRDARRELDENLARVRSLQSHDGPAATRARLTERNGQLTAALMAWRQ